MNVSVDLRSRLIFSVVTGSRNYHDSRIDQFGHSLAELVVPVRSQRGSSQTHVHYFDVVGGVIAISINPVERGQHVGNLARSGRIKNSEINNFGIWGDACVFAAPGVAIAGGGSSYEGAVTINVVNAFFSGEVLTINNT